MSFQHEKPPASQHPQQQQQPSSHTVQISQVITEKQLISRSTQLEDALSKGKFAEYCALKVASSREPIEENIWNFLKVSVMLCKCKRQKQLTFFSEQLLPFGFAEQCTPFII